MFDSVQVVNSDGQTSPAFKVSVKLCSGCNNHGTCLWDVSRNDKRRSDYSQYAQCDCFPEYEGINQIHQITLICHS